MTEHQTSQNQGCSREELARLRDIFERPDPPKRRRHRRERREMTN